MCNSPRTLFREVKNHIMKKQPWCVMDKEEANTYKNSPLENSAFVSEEGLQM